MRRKFKLKIGIGIVVFSFIFIIILNSPSNAEASYSEDVDVDCEEEGGYTTIIRILGYNISYANDNAWHFIFVEASYNFSGKIIEISNDDFFYDISPDVVDTDFLKSKHINETLEIQILREVIGNAIILDMNNDRIILSLNPQSRPYVSRKVDEEDDKESKVSFTLADVVSNTVELWKWYQWFGLGGLCVSFPLLLAVALWRLKIFPIMIFQKHEKYEHFKAGRFISERRSELLPEYWILRFKSGWHQIQEYHCTENLAEIREAFYRKIYLIEEEYPYYIVKTLDLPKHRQFKKEEIAETSSNKVKSFMLKLACRFIPNNKIAERLYESIERVDTEELVTEIPLIQFDLTMAQLTLVGDITYDQKVSHEKEGEKIEKGIIEKEKPYWRYLDLKKDKKVIQKTLKFVKTEMKVVHIKDIKKAIEYRNTIHNERSTYELEKKELQQDLKDTILDLIKARSIATKMDAEFEKRLAEGLREIHSGKQLNLVDFLKSALGEINSGIDIEDAIQKAYTKMKEKEYYLENGDLIRSNSELRAENEQLRETVVMLKEFVKGNGGKINRILKVGDDLTQD